MINSLIPSFPGKRWLKVILRTLHLIGFAGVFASILTDNNYNVYWAIAITSGVGLFLLESLSNLIWFVQVRALVMYIKFALLYALFVLPDYAFHCMILMTVLSGIISHAPGAVRYYSIFHGRVIHSVNDVKG